MEENKIRIMIVDDHPVIRMGLSSCFKDRSQLQVIGEARHSAEALSQNRGGSPDIILLGINSPAATPAEITGDLRNALPETNMIAYSIREDREFILEMIRSGVRGYVFKSSPPEELIQAIHTVHAGEVYLHHRVCSMLVSDYIALFGRGERRLIPEISEREQEILIKVAEGASSKEIASCLQISVRTVDAHRDRIMRKLGIHSAPGLTRYAISKGLVQIPKSE